MFSYSQPSSSSYPLSSPQTKTHKLNNFTKLSISGPFRTYFIQNSTSSLSIQSLQPSSLSPDNLLIHQNGTELKITVAPGKFASGNLLVTISGPNLQSLTLSSGNVLNSEYPLTLLPNADLNVSSDSRASFTILKAGNLSVLNVMAHTYVNVLQVENFTVASTQYSFVVVNSGKVSQLNGGAINGSLLEMGNVVVKNGNLTALEFSTIFVQVTGTATANASKSRIGVMGGGTVFEISAKESLVTSDGGRVVRQNRQSQQKVQQKVQKLQQKKTPTQQKNNNANILTSAIKQQQKNKTQKIQVPQQLKKNQKGMQIAKVVTPVVVQKKVGK